MAQSPKSFWVERERVDPEKQWLTHYDDWPIMALEAELIYATTSRGLSWESAQEMELWQIAAALGLHRIETRAEHDAREIVGKKEEYWEETREQREEKLSGYSERRKQRELERRQARVQKRSEQKAS